RLARDNKAAFAPVRILRDTVDGVWLDGLPAAADVIVVGQEYVIDGVAIDITYREAAG
ncbi:MAG: efflux RND transporter periplasmic adaptor subunit, partial [Litoreibacter sp.]|nr:efflux RND transporter periplasmic adaptor subunit [Litoreibacter sp.]